LEFPEGLGRGFEVKIPPWGGVRIPSGITQ